MPTDALIIRTSWVYSEFGNNFVKTMLRLGRERDELSVVSDQIGSPTYATDLANAILEIIQNKSFKEPAQTTQIYHYSNEGEISWHEFSKEVFKIKRIDCKVESVTTEEYPTTAKRPKTAILDKSKVTKTFNINVFEWRKSLERCISLIKKTN